MSALRSCHKLPVLFALLFVTLSGAATASAQTATFTGRVTDQNTGLGIPNVAIVAVGNQSGTRVAVSDDQGNYTLSIGSNTNIVLRTYKRLYVFNPALVGYSSVGGFPIVGTRTQNYTGLGLPFAILIFAQAPILLTEDQSLNILTMDGVLQTRDPLGVVTNSYFGSDKRTRAQLYLVDMDLFSGETLSIISAAAIDAQQVNHALVVEDLRKVPGVPWMSQLTVRLPDDLTGPAEFTVTVTARGQTSNAAKLHIK
jgi:hypothetical protein